MNHYYFWIHEVLVIYFHEVLKQILLNQYCFNSDCINLGKNKIKISCKNSDSDSLRFYQLADQSPHLNSR